MVMAFLTEILYGFVEDVDFVWGDEHESLTDERAVPLTAWIEVGAIRSGHFTTVVDRPVRALDGATRILRPDAVRKRELLIDRLVGEVSNLKTIYLTAGREAAAFREWQEQLRPSTWHRFTLTFDEDARIDIAAPDTIPPEPELELVMIAEDPYTDQAWIVDDPKIEPVPEEVTARLVEVFSLNHIHDATFPGDGGGGGSSGSSRSGPPAIPRFHSQRHFERRYHLDGCPVFDSHRDGDLDIYQDPASGRWFFQHHGSHYESRDFGGRVKWHGDDGELYLLFDIAGDIVVFNERSIPVIRGRLR